MSRASSESRISPLTASAVTRATTSLHKSTFHSCASCSRIHVCSSPRCQVSATDKTHILQFLRKIDSVWLSTDVVHTFPILGKLWAQFVDMALYLIPRQGLREQISSIVNTSHSLEIQVTFCCFLLDPQVIGPQMPQFAQPSSGHNGESCARTSQD